LLTFTNNLKEVNHVLLVFGLLVCADYFPSPFFLSGATDAVVQVFYTFSLYPPFWSGTTVQAFIHGGFRGFQSGTPLFYVPF